MESKIIQVMPAHMFTYDGATVSVYHANKGEGLPKHQHSYSHRSITKVLVLVVAQQ